MSTSRASEEISGTSTSKESANSAITKVNQSSNHNIDLEKRLALQLSKITAKKSTPGGDAMASAGIAAGDKSSAGFDPAQKMRDYRSSRGTSAHCIDMAAAVVQAAVQEQQQQLTQQQLALAVQAVQNSNNGALVSFIQINFCFWDLNFYCTYLISMEV